MRPHHSTAAAVCLALLTVLAGCGGLGGTDDVGATGGGADAGGPGSDRAAEVAPADGDPSGDVGDARERAPLAQQADRALVRTGNVTLEVGSFETARDRLVSAARERGGFVAASSETNHGRGNRSWTTGRLVLRVPSGNFTAAFEAVKAGGTVERASSNAVDVTDRVVDLEARLENLRAQRERLRAMYGNASGTEALLSVQERLSSVQSEIERLEGRLRTLQDRVTYATVRVELSEPAPLPEEPPEGRPWYDTPVLAALSSSVDGLLLVGRALVVAGAYAVPYLLGLGVPLVALAWGVRSVRRRGPA